MPQKVGLILGPGALCGAYGAGVASVLGREIYFHKVYGCSVGVFAATFLVTKQFNIMLDVWRNHVYGRLLISSRKFLKGRNILDLEYLTNLFKKDDYLLDIDKVVKEKGRLVHVLTDCSSGKPFYFYPTGENVFDSMMASSAVPYIHPKVEIDGHYFCDGGLSDPYPLGKAIEDGIDKLIIVSNFPNRNNNNLAFRFLKLVSRAIEKSEKSMRLIESWVEHDQSFPDVILLRPSHKILRGFLDGCVDTDRCRINASVDNGIEDAEKFLRATGSF